jgi:CheY-like chemotaxis protein
MGALEILVVEDNPGDSRLLEYALKESQLTHHLMVAVDGIQALALLRKSEPYTHAARPDVIVLDLNLPGKTGLEVLEEIKSDDELKNIPIIVLTSSDRDLDVLVAYRKQASAYLVKPSSLREFEEVIHAIDVLGHSADDN